MTTRVAIYARVSTGEQSPEAQLRELRHYAEHRGFPITREYVDQAPPKLPMCDDLVRILATARIRAGENSTPDRGSHKTATFVREDARTDPSKAAQPPERSKVESILALLHEFLTILLPFTVRNR